MTLTKLTLTVTCAALFCVSLPAQAPVVDVDYHKHLKLWRAQKRIVAAYEDVEQAEAAQDGEGDHMKNARNYLTQAAKELKLAEEYAAKKQH